MKTEAQSTDVKRAQVEFHNFASLGEPERASRIYREENERRAGILTSMASFIGPMTPFLEIGANAGHTSLMLMNELGADGFALDISADSLRHGYALMDQWGVTRGPIRMAGDALRLPFKDNSLRVVLAFQMLSQFMDIEAIFVEVKRVLAPGGLFIFSEEPLRRLATLRLWRTPYYEQMKPWERKLSDWGLLPFLVKDVIGAGQEESFGIRQNHTMGLSNWHDLVTKHFDAHEYRMFVPDRGPWERAVKKIAISFDPHHSEWRAAKLLGGTLSAACRKAGSGSPDSMPERFETLLCCPDCGSDLSRNENDSLRCAMCAYAAPLEGGVYNLLNSADRSELYPGEREDVIDFSMTGHEKNLLDGWYQLEGTFGNKYRWIGDSASAVLKNLRGGPQRIRVRGFRPERSEPTRIKMLVNEQMAGEWKLDRPGLFVLAAALPASDTYNVKLEVSPVHTAPNDDRQLSVNISMIRLLPA